MARIALNGKSRRKHGPVEVSRNKKKGGSKRPVCSNFRIVALNRKSTILNLDGLHAL